jgi:hypothetical protein
MTATTTVTAGFTELRDRLDGDVVFVRRPYNRTATNSPATHVSRL